MNRFGRQAQHAWQTLAPTAYAAIENPEQHFTELGEAAEAEWADLWPNLAGPDVPDESYTDKIGRLNNARARAEEIIRADWLTPADVDCEPDDGDEPHPLTVELMRIHHETMVEAGLRDPAIDYGI